MINRDETYDWRDDALCAQVGGGGWFVERPDAAHEVKKICGKCPVIDSCRDMALRDVPTDGIWAGMSPSEIKRLVTSAK